MSGSQAERKCVLAGGFSGPAHGDYARRLRAGTTARTAQARARSAIGPSGRLPSKRRRNLDSNFSRSSAESAAA
jgi:hypothetical protein